MAGERGGVHACRSWPTFGRRPRRCTLAVSDDGFAWTPLNGNRPLLRLDGAAGTLRDPHISQARDGRFHLVFTGGWTTTGIEHCTSPDLLDWSPPETIPVMAGVLGTRNCWAPECFYDLAEDRYRLLRIATASSGRRR